MYTATRRLSNGQNLREFRGLRLSSVISAETRAGLGRIKRDHPTGETIMFRRLTILLGLALLILGATASSKSIKHFGRDHIRVDGVKLEHRREVEVKGPLTDLLEIESGLGDIEIIGVSGNEARLTIEIFEYKPDDVHVELREDGRVVLRSDGDHPAAIGRVYAEVPRGIDLLLETGLGDIEISDMQDGGTIEVATGMGGITIAQVNGYREIDAASGKGDIRLGPCDGLDRVDMATGMGGIKVKNSRIEDLDVSSGMGSIRFLDCDLGFVSGGTGMGSVHFKRTKYRESDVSSGLGRVTGR
jgi:hypothetical protein